MKPSTAKLIRVAVLESDPLHVLGLQEVLSADRNIRIHAGTVESVLNSRYDELVLMTTDRGPSFSYSMAALKAARPDVRIIVIAPGRRDEDILRAMSAGAKGYVAREASSDILRKAIREVHGGSVWMPRRVVARFIENATAFKQPLPALAAPEISRREREVLRLLVEGCSNKEIANELRIIESTVKAHVAQLLRKTGVANRTALSVQAVSMALLGEQDRKAGKSRH